VDMTEVAVADTASVVVVAVAVLVPALAVDLT